MGIAFVFGSSGVLDISSMSAQAGEVMSSDSGTSYLFGIAMITIALGYHIAAVPFHCWIVDSAESSSTPISSFLTTAPKAAALLLLFRFTTAVFAAP